MPDISATIRTMTLADGTVSGLVSTRMYSDTLPQNATLPAIRYAVVDATPNEHLSGIVGVSRARIQIDCYANTRAAANALADGVRLALEKQNHTLVGAQYINDIAMISGPADARDRAKAGEDEVRFISTMDFFVYYNTTTS